MTNGELSRIAIAYALLGELAFQARFPVLGLFKIVEQVWADVALLAVLVVALTLPGMAVDRYARRAPAGPWWKNASWGAFLGGGGSLLMAAVVPLRLAIMQVEVSHPTPDAFARGTIETAMVYACLGALIGAVAGWRARRAIAQRARDRALRSPA